MALDVTRAGQWPSVAGNFERRSDFVSPACGGHYGRLLVALGRWTEAEQELLEGNESYPVARRALAAIALARGEMALAEELARLCLDGERPAPCAPAIDVAQ